MSSKYSSRRRGKGGGRTFVAVAFVALVALGVALGSRDGNDSKEAAGSVRQGEVAPAVRLPATTGDTIDLADYRGKRNVLLYFYEHAG
jgi:cytochrome oxidase Cu insertion factor (SCO1/SenC/PrrC family)